jgi:hypothetical protein
MTVILGTRREQITLPALPEVASLRLVRRPAEETG